ncbi:MAG: AMP-binding protein [Anaerolineales bacterium]|nr:AMP-binding protein [Anaerolineales bacterium]
MCGLDVRRRRQREEERAPGGVPRGADLAPPDANSTIPERMRYLTARLPDQIAVIDDEQSLTYVELDAAADRLANVLIARLGVAPEPVALLLPNQVAIAIGILGVLKAGKFYAPLDPTIEPAVRQTILAECGARILLTVKQLLPGALAHAAPGLEVIEIDALAAATSMGEQAPHLHPRSYALLTFTSGTTGVAKGVLADHSNLLFRARQAYWYDQITPADRVGQLVTPTFALFASVFFTTLLNGATLIFYDRSAAGMSGLLTWVADAKLSVFYAPVSLLRDLLTAPGPLPCIPSVRTVLLGGQSFVLRDLLGLRSVVEPGCTVVNRLSMSEVLLVAP